MMFVLKPVVRLAEMRILSHVVSIITLCVNHACKYFCEVNLHEYVLCDKLLNKKLHIHLIHVCLCFDSELPEVYFRWGSMGHH